MNNLSKEKISVNEIVEEILCENWFNETIILSISNLDGSFVGNGNILEGFDCEIDDEDICIRNNQNLEWIFKRSMIKFIHYEEDVCGITISIILNNEIAINLMSTTV